MHPRPLPENRTPARRGQGRQQGKCCRDGRRAILMRNEDSCGKPRHVRSPVSAADLGRHPAGPSGSASRARRPLDRRRGGRRGSATRARWRAKPPRPNPFHRTRRLVRKPLCRPNTTVRASPLPTCWSAAMRLIVLPRLKRQRVAKPIAAASVPRLADAEFADSRRLVAVAPG